MGCDAKEIKAAVEAGWKEWGNFRRDMRKKGEETLKYIREHDRYCSGRQTLPCRP